LLCDCGANYRMRFTRTRTTDADRARRDASWIARIVWHAGASYLLIPTEVARGSGMISPAIPI